MVVAKYIEQTFHYVDSSVGDGKNTLIGLGIERNPMTKKPSVGFLVSEHVEKSAQKAMSPRVDIGQVRDFVE